MRFLTRIWNSLSTRYLDRELREEMDAHLEMLEDAARQEGLSDAETRERARQRFGSRAAYLERTRDVNLSVWLREFVQDAQFALRQMRKQPGFTAVSAFVIALGIGAVTTVFSLVNAVLVHSLPYRDLSQLVYIWTPNPQFGPNIPQEIGPNDPDIADWEKRSRSFSSIAILNHRMVNLSTRSGVSKVAAAAVTSPFFSTLGVQPELGRPITRQDDQPGHEHVAVISHALWQELFAAQPGALGKTIQINRSKYVVIGVMPPEFGYPFEGDIPYIPPGFGRTNIWMPLALTARDYSDRANVSSADAVIARLRPRTTARQAQAELAAFEKNLDRLYPPELGGWGVLVRPLVDTILGPVRMMLWLLMGAVALVLLIACGNVANLCLARMTARSEEIAIRLSLGAGRLRLVRQVFTESVMLALVGCAVGLAFSLGAVRLLLTLNPGNIPRFDQASLSWPVLLLAVTVSILSGLFFALAPALLATRFNLSESLKKSGNRASTGTSRRFGDALIAGEVALSLVLLAGAGLLIRSYLKLEAQNPGYSGSTLTMNLQLDDRYNKPEQRSALFMKYLQRIRQIPGVISAGAGSDIPLDHFESVDLIEIKGYGKPKTVVDGRTITPGYLSAFGEPLIAGRPFVYQDFAHADRVVIVNQAFVRAFLGGRDPLTGQIRSGLNVPNRPWASIIGVVKDRRHSTPEETPRPEYFYPFGPTYDNGNLHYAIRSRLPANEMAAAAAKALREIDPDLALDDVRTMDQRISEANARRRFQTVLLSSFSFLAILLALAGIYSVLAYSVRQRTREMGLRMAIGASPVQLFVMVLRQGLSAAALGLVIGIAGAFFVTKLISSWLYEVPANDPVTFTAIPVLVLFVAAAACLVPARNAIRVDPAVAIRNE